MILMFVEEKVLNFEPDQEREICRRRNGFEIEPVSHHYSRAPGIYQKDQRVKILSYTSGVEISIKFWRLGLP